MTTAAAPRRAPEEVLSVPAGASFAFIVAYHVHAHPADAPGYRYRPSRYLAFRRAGGVMDALFAVEHIFDLCPDDATPLDRQPLAEAAKERVRRYIAARRERWEFGSPDAPFRFYVLSDAANIALPHAPRTRAKRVRGACYFTVRELTSGHPLVDVASKAGGAAATGVG